MFKNDVITWKKSKDYYQSQIFLCQNSPNKVLLKVTKYLGSSKSSLEVILRSTRNLHHTFIQKFIKIKIHTIM